MKKFEYALDVFKGTCELNNYKSVSVDYSKGVTDKLVPCIKGNKSYYYGLTYDKKSNFVFGAINSLEPDVYSVCEVINVAFKLLWNLEIEDMIVDIVSDSFLVDELISNLDAIEIAADLVDGNPSDGEELSFSISVDGLSVVHGGIRDGKTYFEIKYSDLEKVYDYKVADVKSDVYISATDKESLSDAFIIGSNLRDAGFKVEVDYTLKQVKAEEIDATFLVTFGKKEIEKYEVKLIDLATKEMKTVGIDNLIEELAFI